MRCMGERAHAAVTSAWHGSHARDPAYDERSTLFVTSPPDALARAVPAARGFAPPQPRRHARMAPRASLGQ